MNETQPNLEIEALKKELGENLTYQRVLRTQLDAALAENARLAASALQEHTRTKKLEDERDAALAACAEMRDALNAIGQCPACGGDGVIHLECQACLSGEPERCTCPNEPAQPCPVCQENEKAIYDKVKHAISIDCGKDFEHKSKREAVEAKCAALRDVLEQSKHDNFGHRLSAEWFIARDRVLLLDAGHGWLSPEKSKTLVEALTLLYEETASYITINHLGDVHHNMSMQKAREALTLVKEDTL